MRSMRVEPAAPQSSRLVWTLLGICCAVFVFAIARQVLPVGTMDHEEESAIQLQERLADERSDLQKSLQSELTEWEEKNDQLKQEIATLTERETE